MPQFDQMYFDQKWSLWDGIAGLGRVFKGFVMTASYRMGNIITSQKRRGEVVTTQKRRGEIQTTGG